MDIACLFGGGGLASLGLALAGHRVTSIELDPRKHALAHALAVAHGHIFTCILADVRDVDLSGYDAVWASPPCKLRSSLNHKNASANPYSRDLLGWSLALSHPTLWVENTRGTGEGHGNRWGVWWNAAQFTETPRQCRNRLIGGRYFNPMTYHAYRWAWPGVCPAITPKATECSQAVRRESTAVKFYGRALTIDEMAYHQGLTIPDAWREIASKTLIADAIGNGVPVYMAQAFGAVYTGL